ncbi:MAG: hypothetical protein KDA99_29060, partial [Planctomycetales bacterium]|nr:hypothetical protein [Planctomycetales bacterium]
TKDDQVEIPVQVNGKVRAKVVVPAESSQSEIEERARQDERVAELLAGKQLVKCVVVPGRLINFVVK